MVHAAAYCSGSFTVMLTSTTIGFRCALSRFGSRLLMQQALSQLSQTQLQQVFRTNGPPQQQDPESHGRTTLSTMEARQGRAQQQYKQPSPSRLGYLMLQHGMSHIGCAPRGAHQQRGLATTLRVAELLRSETRHQFEGLKALTPQREPPSRALGIFFPTTGSKQLTNFLAPLGRTLEDLRSQLRI